MGERAFARQRAVWTATMLRPYPCERRSPAFRQPDLRDTPEISWQRAREGGVGPSAQHWRVLTVPWTRANHASPAGHGLQARSKSSHVPSDQVNRRAASRASCQQDSASRLAQWPHRGGSIQVAASEKNRHSTHVPLTIAAYPHQTRRPSPICRAPFAGHGEPFPDYHNRMACEAVECGCGKTAVSNVIERWPDAYARRCRHFLACARHPATHDSCRIHGSRLPVAEAFFPSPR